MGKLGHRGKEGGTECDGDRKLSGLYRAVPMARVLLMGLWGPGSGLGVSSRAPTGHWKHSPPG